MLRKKARIVATITALLLGIGTISASAEPSYYPEGPQVDVDIETLLQGGWELCFEENYMETDTPVDSLLNGCTGDYIILSGRHITDSTLLLLAAAPRSDVFTPTEGQAVRLSNGTYWYFTPIEDEDANSIGFSGTPIVNINTCDYSNNLSLEDEATKLCWHIYEQNGIPTFDDGYRLGAEDGPDVYNGNYLRLAFQAFGLPTDPLFAQDARFNDLVEACRRDFTTVVKALKSPSLPQYNSCLFYDVTSRNIAGVNTEILDLYKASVAAGKPMDDGQIIVETQKLALRHNVIDRLVNQPDTVYFADLVNIGLTGLNEVSSRYKAMSALRALPANQKDTFEKLKAAIAALK